MFPSDSEDTYFVNNFLLCFSVISIAFLNLLSILYFSSFSNYFQTVIRPLSRFISQTSRICMYYGTYSWDIIVLYFKCVITWALESEQYTVMWAACVVLQAFWLAGWERMVNFVWVVGPLSVKSEDSHLLSHYEGDVQQKEADHSQKRLTK